MPEGTRLWRAAGMEAAGSSRRFSVASLSVTLISQPLPQLSSRRRGRWRLPGSGVGLEAETLTLPRGKPCREAPRARHCSRAVVSPNETCVFHCQINNSPGMSGLPASSEGWFWQAGALPAAVVSGHGARSEAACWGRGHGSGGLPTCAAMGALPAVLSPGAQLPSLGEGFPASPSQGLARGLGCSELGHAGRGSLLCLRAAALPQQEQSLHGCSELCLGQPRERKAPPDQDTSIAVPDTLKPIAGTQPELGFPGSELRGAQHSPCQLQPILLGLTGSWVSELPAGLEGSRDVYPWALDGARCEGS